MDLKHLIQPLVPYSIQGKIDKQVMISSLEMDHRQVGAGSLFVCIPGFRVDGHQFAGQAVEQGAVAIIAQQPLPPLSVPVIIVSDTRRALAILADRFYGSPSRQLKVIGITGTNGKTTTTYLLEKMIEDQGYATGRIGTIDMKIGDQLMKVRNTTPESLELQKAFAQMVASGSTYCVMEASSHAIHMGRVRGCSFRSVIFTNLTQDHLDYHGTMEEYKRAKGLIFAQLGNEYNQQELKVAILNADDEAHVYYKEITPVQILTYGIDNDKADVKASHIKLTPQGTSFRVDSYLGTEEFSLRLLGTFNIYNALAAIAAGLVEGFDLGSMKNSLASIPGVRGRLEPVDGGQPFTLLVDYAHTPDSLANVLSTIREFAQGKVICLIGCGGDRDKGKRPLMAQIAVQYADMAIFTSDNPRSEDPDQIIQDMIQGLDPFSQSKRTYHSILDRKEAIRWAIQQADEHDVVLIAGKGHETTQEIKGQHYPFDDRLVALEAIQG